MIKHYCNNKKNYKQWNNGFLDTAHQLQHHIMLGTMACMVTSDVLIKPREREQ